MMAGEVVLASERLGTAWLGAFILLALSVVRLTMAPQVFRVLEATLADTTLVGVHSGWIVSLLMTSGTLSARDRLFDLCQPCSTHLARSLEGKLSPQEEHA